MTNLTYVLIHGAWHGSWCWRRIIPLLSAKGHHVVAVTLTGLGDRTHLANADVDLDTHVTDVVAFLEMEDLSDVVLVGHSYGGMVITGVAERTADRIRRLIYLDALVPSHGQSAFDLNSDAFRERLEKEARESGDGFTFSPMSPDAMGITDSADAQWVRIRLTPQPIGTFRQPVDAKERVPAIPATYILCTQFGLHETATRCKQNGWPVLEIESGHDVMVTKPNELADLLLSPECQ